MSNINPGDLVLVTQLPSYWTKTLKVGDTYEVSRIIKNNPTYSHPVAIHVWLDADKNDDGFWLLPDQCEVVFKV